MGLFQNLDRFHEEKDLFAPCPYNFGTTTTPNQSSLLQAFVLTADEIRAYGTHGYDIPRICTKTWVD